MYIVEVEKAPASYQKSYFPREAKYLKEAKEIAQKALNAGAVNVKVKHKNGKVFRFV